MTSAWEKRRQTITADELFRTAPSAPDPSPAYVPPTPRQGWLERKLTNARWPWREIGLLLLACVLGAGAWLFITSLDLTLPRFPRRGQSVQSAPTALPTVAVLPTQQPVIVERIVIITATPAPAYVPPSRPQQPVQRAERRPLPAPTQAPQPAAWPAPAQPQPQPSGAYGCTGILPCRPPSSAPTKRAIYVCADGAEFPQDDSRWAFMGFGEWHARGQGDVLDIQDGNRNTPSMGWHYNCKREWR